MSEDEVLSPSKLVAGKAGSQDRLIRRFAMLFHYWPPPALTELAHYRHTCAVNGTILRYRKIAPKNNCSLCVSVLPSWV